MQVLEGVRQTFRAVFVRFGSKSAYSGPPIPTALFRDVTDAAGEPMCDHLWFTVGKQMEALALQADEVIEFDARVTRYEKGYKGHRWDVDAPISTDYRLSRPM